MILNDNEKTVLFLNKKVNKEIFIDIKQRLPYLTRKEQHFFGNKAYITAPQQKVNFTDLLPFFKALNKNMKNIKYKAILKDFHCIFEAKQTFLLKYCLTYYVDWYKDIISNCNENNIAQVRKYYQLVLDFGNRLIDSYDQMANVVDNNNQILSAIDAMNVMDYMDFVQKYHTYNPYIIKIFKQSYFRTGTDFIERALMEFIP